MLLLLLFLGKTLTPLTPYYYSSALSGIHVSRQTLQKTFHEIELKGYRPRTSPLLTPKHIKCLAQWFSSRVLPEQFRGSASAHSNLRVYFIIVLYAYCLNIQ